MSVFTPKGFPVTKRWTIRVAKRKDAVGRHVLLTQAIVGQEPIQVIKVVENLEATIEINLLQVSLELAIEQNCGCKFASLL